jgi:hypothetical protein
MRSRSIALGSVLAVATLAIGPAQGRQVSPEEHAKHHPAAPAAQVPPAPPATPAPRAKEMGGMMKMMGANARLEELVTKMNAAQGQAKVDAMAELLTALVHQHQTMHGGAAK